MRKILLVNGPPRSGKTSLIRALTKQMPRVNNLKISTPLYDFLWLQYQMSRGWVETHKDSPSEILHGKAPREVLIALSDWYRKTFRSTILAECACDRINSYPEGTSFTLDIGKMDEATYVVDKFGLNSVRLVRLHRLGSTFDKDRHYLDGARLGILTTDIYNDDALEKLDNLVGIFVEWLKT